MASPMWRAQRSTQAAAAGAWKHWRRACGLACSSQAVAGSARTATAAMEICLQPWQSRCACFHLPVDRALLEWSSVRKISACPPLPCWFLELAVTGALSTCRLSPRERKQVNICKAVTLQCQCRCWPAARKSMTAQQPCCPTTCPVRPTAAALPAAALRQRSPSACLLRPLHRCKPPPECAS